MKKFHAVFTLVLVTCVTALKSSNQWVQVPRLSLQTYQKSSANFLHIPGTGRLVDRLQLSMKSLVPLNSTSSLDSTTAIDSTSSAARSNTAATSVDRDQNLRIVKFSPSPEHSKKTWSIGARYLEQLESRKNFNGILRADGSGSATWNSNSEHLKKTWDSGRRNSHSMSQEPIGVATVLSSGNVPSVCNSITMCNSLSRV